MSEYSVLCAPSFVLQVRSIVQILFGMCVWAIIVWQFYLVCAGTMNEWMTLTVRIFSHHFPFLLLLSYFVHFVAIQVLLVCATSQCKTVHISISGNCSILLIVYIRVSDVVVNSNAAATCFLLLFLSLYIRMSSLPILAWNPISTSKCMRSCMCM